MIKKINEIKKPIDSFTLRGLQQKHMRISV